MMGVTMSALKGASILINSLEEKVNSQSELLSELKNEINSIKEELKELKEATAK